ncbi:hypothetical protein EV424DRAFT_1588033 [Suillus variegatus]|nr:hypothetical protein EV424DRAFT_1588033 [Suillus variegatus]
MSKDDMPQPIEFFIASDASAIVEHTKCMLYLENDDISHITEGQLAIHHLRQDESGKAETPAIRNIEMLKIEIAEIMKGKFDHFMQKEIHEKPESVVNTMHRYMNFDDHSSHYGLLARSFEQSYSPAAVELPLEHQEWRLTDAEYDHFQAALAEKNGRTTEDMPNVNEQDEGGTGNDRAALSETESNTIVEAAPKRGTKRKAAEPINTVTASLGAALPVQKRLRAPRKDKGVPHGPRKKKTAQLTAAPSPDASIVSPTATQTHSNPSTTPITPSASPSATLSAKPSI